MSGPVYEQLTLFPEDSPANPLVWLESKKAGRMTVTYGLKCSGLSPSLRRVGLSVRTYLESSTSRLTMFVPIWSVRATKSGYTILKLRLSEHHTEENESHLWPTARAADAMSGAYQYDHGDHSKPRATLAGAARMWPTPTVPNGGRSLASVTDWKSDRTAYKNGRKVQVDLNAAVRMWPTPRAQMWKDGVDSIPPSRIADPGKDNLAQRVARTLLPTPSTPRPHDNENTAGKYMPTQNQKDLASVVARDGGQLNPTWVEWLMGYPQGWTDLNA